MEKGGYADKIGGRYEDRWALRLLLDLLSGELEALEREPVGEDEPGVDLWANHKDGLRECFQCKAENGDKPQWSIADLRRVGVLAHLRGQLDRSTRHRFCFVSSTPAPELKDLCRSATDSRDAQSFFESQVKASQKRTKAFSNFCKAVGLSPGSEADLERARDLLSRSRFHQFQEDEWGDLRGRLRTFVNGDPELVLRALGDWLRDQFRKPLTVSAIKAVLEPLGIRLLFASSVESLAVFLKTLQERFFHSLKYNLAGGRLIERDETRQVLEALNDSSDRVVVVHGVAGSGKSGVLYELASDLADRGVPFVPLRLDRVELKGTPQRFGTELGLPHSPAKCLDLIAGGQRAFLLLDQLDALRWTSAHSSEAWDVCRELIAEALSFEGIQVVVCCRTFDLEHDPQLRGWERETRNLRRIDVRDLSEEDVKKAVAQACEGRHEPPALRARERELLRHVQHLQMWLTIYTSTQEVPRFDTALALMETFWANRMDELERTGIDKVRAEQLRDRLVDAMEDGARLSAPLHHLSASEKELEILQSIHLLQAEPGRRLVSFCHQSYLDYLVVRRIQSELNVGRRTVVEWLGSKKSQSLFRTEQLRLLLGALREEESEAYLPAMRELLGRDDRVRFHLRQLALLSLGQLTDPRAEEVHLVLELLEQPFWWEHVLADVIGGNAAWFEVLDDQGKPQEWLASDDARIRDAALRIIRPVAKKSGNRVVCLLGPYLGRDKEWLARVVWSLPLDPGGDSDDLFDLRLKLVDEGSYIESYTNWRNLAKSNPTQFFLLASKLLMALAGQMSRGDRRRRPGRRSKIDWYGLDDVDISTMTPAILLQGWGCLAVAIGKVSASGLRGFEDSRTLVPLGSACDFDTLELVIRLLRKMGAVGTTFAEELAAASRDISTRITADVHYLVPLLLRLYEQTKNDADAHQRCLDLWDRLLERSVGEAMGLTRDLDRIQ